MEKLDKFFKISERGSSLKIEILAGISTFLSLSYICIVNPTILAAAGMNTSAVFFATIIGSVISCMLMGIWARLPFAVAPGLEMNAYVAYVVVGTMGFTWQQALGAIFWSGIFTVFFSYTPLRVNVIKAIPDKLKSGISAAVGVFLMLIALKVSGVLFYEGIKVKGLGNLSSNEALVFFAGLVLVSLLKHFKIKGFVLISIILASIFAHFIGIAKPTDQIKLNEEMYAATLALDFSVISNPKVWSVVLVLFILDFYGSIAKFIGLTRNTTIVDKDGNLPRLKEGLVVDGLGTVVGALTGTSNLITYVESAVGIGEGGRTGLVAIVVAILFASFLLLTPLINLVPGVATTGALFYVGVMLFPNKQDLKSYQLIDIVSATIIVITTFFTFGLDKAMFAGFASYLFLYLLSGRAKEINIYLTASTFLLFLGIYFS